MMQFCRVAVFLLGLTLRCNDGVFAQVFPADFARVLVTNGLANPTAMAFAPDGLHAACSNKQDGMRWLRVDDGALVRSLGRGPARSPFAFHAATGRLAVCGDSVQVKSGIVWLNGKPMKREAMPDFVIPVTPNMIEPSRATTNEVG